MCAGVEFCSPARLMARAVAGSRRDGTPDRADADPWHPDRAVWPLLEVIDACREEPWAALLWAHLGAVPGEAELDPSRRGRRWSITRQLTGLFAAYAVHRPAMVDAWAHGRDLDAAGAPLTSDRAWQAELWRRLRDRLGVPGPVQRLDAAVHLLRSTPESTDLPARLSLFGPTRIEPDQLAVLTALAAHRDVHLWLPHPSAVLWSRIAKRLDEGEPADDTRARDATALLVRHGLLAYLGRDSRELQLTLRRSAPSGSVDLHHAADSPAPRTLLTHLQADLIADRPARLSGDRPWLDSEDRSIQVHASHGPDRQVEVLREVLVGLLADDPTLEPRDIVVMCPDIEVFAPLIAAAFGLDSGDSAADHPGHQLRVRLADRSLRQLNPLLAVLSRLIALVESRMEVSAVLDLCAAPAVASRFGFGTDQLERLQELVAHSGARWGLDPAHRARFQMAEFAQNTWSAGLDRMLLGVAMDEAEPHFIGTALPLDDVDSGDVDLVGRLAEVVDRLRALTEACQLAQPLGDWIDLFRRTLELLTSVPASQSWQHAHAHQLLAQLAEAGSTGAPGPSLELAEVSALLADTMRGRASRANFRTGTLTVCTLLPMRSVPHRVVCLLGLDDGVFPRQRRVDGDDIAADEDRIGDRDLRSEDRQLLLDAILAARETLVVVYAGADPRTGTRLPPAVPVGELMDALDLTARTADGQRVSEAVTVRHPLQPFDPANFASVTGPRTRRPRAAGRPGTVPFSFDRAGLRGTLALRR